PGDKNPSRAKPRTCATVNPSSLETSREVYPFIPPLAPSPSYFALGRRSRLRLLALDPLGGFAFAHSALAFQARLERLHQIDDLRLGRLGRLLGYLFALHFVLTLLDDSLVPVL